jgi:hypothetical protein
MLAMGDVKISLYERRILHAIELIEQRHVAFTRVPSHGEGRAALLISVSRGTASIDVGNDVGEIGEDANLSLGRIVQDRGLHPHLYEREPEAQNEEGVAGVGQVRAGTLNRIGGSANPRQDISTRMYQDVGPSVSRQVDASSQTGC